MVPKTTSSANMETLQVITVKLYIHFLRVSDPKIPYSKEEGYAHFTANRGQ